MEDKNMTKSIQSRLSLLCAVLSALAAVLLFSLPFALSTAIVGALLSAAGIVLSVISLKGENGVEIRSLIALIVSLAAIITVIVLLIINFSSVSLLQNTGGEFYIQ